MNREEGRVAGGRRVDAGGLVRGKRKGIFFSSYGHGKPLKSFKQENHSPSLVWVLGKGHCENYGGPSSDPFFGVYFVFFVLQFYFIYLFIFVFLGPHPRHMEVPRLGSNQSCSCWPMPEPQQCGIRAVSVTSTTAHGNARSLTH